MRVEVKMADQGVKMRMIELGGCLAVRYMEDDVYRYALLVSLNSCST